MILVGSGQTVALPTYIASLFFSDNMISLVVGPLLSTSKCAILSYSVAALISLSASPTGSPSLSLGSAAPPPTTMPVLDAIQVYGRLAGSACFGKVSPAGSSCQISKDELLRKLGLVPTSSLSREAFASKLNDLQFRWPLKPYGVAENKSNDKTATMNKGAETRLYMDQLEERGLYDRRNPTGPLPTSLRPKLNAALQREGLSQSSVARIYDLLKGDGTSELTTRRVEQLFGDKEALDYYDFLKLLGENSILWPGQ